MEIIITINGKPVQATVDDAVIREAMGEKKAEKRTGYERESKCNDYYYLSSLGGIDVDVEANATVDDGRFYAGNYFTCQKVAENNARADALMRNLRRFAAENGGCVSPVHLNEGNCSGYTIFKADAEIKVCTTCRHTDFGEILFPSAETANAAIKVFRDELLWYFTEYDPMPEGWWDE